MTVTRRLTRIRRRGRRGGRRLPLPPGRQGAATGSSDGSPHGYIVLAMGKYGAFELNYSSDIDLIVFYDLARIRLRAGPRGAALLRAPDARSRAPAQRAHRRRLRVPHRSAPAPRPRRHAARALDRRPRSTTTRASARTGSAPRSSRPAPAPATSPRAAPSWTSLRPSSGASTSTSRPSPTSTP